MYYHVWLVTKYRKAILEGKIERKVKDYFLEVARNKSYNILEMETNRDHVHMLLEAKNTKELANMVRILKSISAKKILEETPHLRVGNVQHFWAKRYGSREIKKEYAKNIVEYIRNQKKIPHT